MTSASDTSVLRGTPAGLVVDVLREGGQWRVTGAPQGIAGHDLTPTRSGRPGSVYVTWRWEAECLTVRNDRYGMFPAYYFATADRFCLSTSVSDLIERGAPTALDDEALGVFLRLGYFLQEETPFRAIRSLPPDAVVTWSPSGLSVTGTPPRPAPQSPSRDEIIERYGQLFTRAVEASLGGEQAAVPLSGGRDSRHILLALNAAGEPPVTTVTVQHYPPRRNEDARVAALVAAAAGVPHVTLAQPANRLDVERRKNELTSYCTAKHAAMLAVRDHVAGRVTRVYDGLAGDVLSQSRLQTLTALQKVEDGRFDELAEELLDRDGDESIIRRTLRPDAYARWPRERARARVAAALERHAGAPNPLAAFYLWTRTRRDIALSPYALLGSAAEVVCPFLDEELFDFLFALPARSVIGTQLHTAVIARAYPDFAGVPYEQPSSTPRQERGYFRRLALDLTRSLLAHRSRLVSHRQLLPPLARLAVDGAHQKFWVPMTRVVHLLQIERLATGPTGSETA